MATKLGDWHNFFGDLLSRQGWTTGSKESGTREENRQSSNTGNSPIGSIKVLDDKILIP